MSTVSVVTPTHDRTDFLAEAIQSVIAQSHTDLELIVVENGPKRDAERVINRFGDSRIRYAHLPEANRSAARNQGMALATGRYLSFLDDDDVYLSHKLARQVAYLESHLAVDLVAGGTYLMDERGRVIDTWSTWQSQPQLTVRNCLVACPLPTCAVLVRRHVVLSADHRFDELMSRAEDKDFFVRLLHAGCRMAWQKEIVSAYRLHAQNSKGDGATFSWAHRRIVSKVLDLPHVSASVKADADLLYAHAHLTGALRAYAGCHLESARQELAAAVRLDPSLVQGALPPIVVRIATFADTHRVLDPSHFIDQVYDNLPELVDHLRRHRRVTHARFHIGRVFRQRAGGRTPSVANWLRGVWYDVRWLTNRGLWVILARDILPAMFHPRPRPERGDDGLSI